MLKKFHDGGDEASGHVLNHGILPPHTHTQCVEKDMKSDVGYVTELDSRAKTSSYT